jgi:hypothetical protein
MQPKREKARQAQRGPDTAQKQSYNQGDASQSELFMQSGDGLPLNRAALSLKDFE